MNKPLHTLGVLPNAWRVNAEIADITRPAMPPRPATVRTQTKKVRLDLAKAAILVIDMQNIFCNTEGWLANNGVDVNLNRKPIEPLNQLLPALRAADVPVIWVNWGNRPDLLNISASVSHIYNPTGGTVETDPLSKNNLVLTKNSWAAEVVEELQVLPEDIKVDKHRMSGFWDTPLDSILRNMGKTTLFFAGVYLDQCVMSTLEDANFLGYDCIMVSDCTGTASPEYSWPASIYTVKQYFGFVTDSQSIIDGIKNSEGNQNGQE